MPQIYPALYNLDKKHDALCPEIPNGNTYYIKVRATDGYHQSNTYFLEKIYGARGFPAEPTLNNYERFIINRSNRNNFACCALVGPDYHEKYLELINSNLMTYSTITDSGDLGHSAQYHYDIGRKFLHPLMQKKPIFFVPEQLPLLSYLISQVPHRILAF